IAPRMTVRDLQRKIAINVANLQKLAQNVVRRCLQFRTRKGTDLSKLREISLWLISDRLMARLHRDFLGQSGPTDVLTFQHGEIFISVETAKRHARIFDNPLERELQLYIVHGLLHFHGLGDRTSAEARKMKNVLQKILHDAL